MLDILGLVKGRKARLRFGRAQVEVWETVEYNDELMMPSLNPLIV